jgi:hypothetical protein
MSLFVTLVTNETFVHGTLLFMSIVCGLIFRKELGNFILVATRGLSLKVPGLDMMFGDNTPERALAIIDGKPNTPPPVVKNKLAADKLRRPTFSDGSEKDCIHAYTHVFEYFNTLAEGWYSDEQRRRPDAIPHLVRLQLLHAVEHSLLTSEQAAAVMLVLDEWRAACINARGDSTAEWARVFDRVWTGTRTAIDTAIEAS